MAQDIESPKPWCPKVKKNLEFVFCPLMNVLPNSTFISLTGQLTHKRRTNFRLVKVFDINGFYLRKRNSLEKLTRSMQCN